VVVSATIAHVTVHPRALVRAADARLRALIAVTVGLLICGVVVMHSLGPGRHGTHHVATAVSGQSATPSVHGGTAAPGVVQPTAAATRESPTGSDVGAVCLAVLPALAGLLLVLLARVHRRRLAVNLSSRALARRPRPRGPPHHLAPSLASLCVLRT